MKGRRRQVQVLVAEDQQESGPAEAQGVSGI